MDYKRCWDYQEFLLKGNLDIKNANRDQGGKLSAEQVGTKNYLLFVEHDPVYTLGKSGKMHNVLITEQQRNQKGIDFYHTNRGGDITFHGPEQIVGYPILDLEKFYTDIGRYLRALEEVIIRTLSGYGIEAVRITGQTGVWVHGKAPGTPRKICAMGVRCSRWITMHGFALNVNTDLGYFDYIIPCGLENNKVTSMKKELGKTIDLEKVKHHLIKDFEEVFNAKIVETNPQNSLGR
ncbi:MAG: lipoyl(octanoyl) transferase LipB [Flavisolibacter sp.]